MRIHLDTNALIVEPAWDRLPAGSHELAISSIAYAEYSEGVHHQDPAVVAATARGILAIEDTYGFGIPFDGRAARMYRVLCSAVSASGRTIGRARRIDLMIAAVAAADGAALLTHNTRDFVGVQDLVTVLDASR